MTETAATRQAANDHGNSDHYPSCPHCGNLCGLLAVICVDCGTRLRLSDDELRTVRYQERMRRVNAAQTASEATQATRGTEA